MLEGHRLDVETSTNLNVDPKPVITSPRMTTHHREYPPHPTTRPSEPSHRDASPSHLPPINNGHHSARDDYISDVIYRMQSQADHNTRQLDSQNREIDRLSIISERLQTGMENLYSHFESLTAEFRARPPPAAERSDAALADIDILTSQIQNLTGKTNEIEGLKMQLDILKRRIRRLEGQGSPPPTNNVQSVEPSPYQPPTSHLHGSSSVPVHGGTPSSESRTVPYQPPVEHRLPPPSALQGSDSRNLSDFPPSAETRTLPGFRQMEAASGLSSWRSASSYTPGQPAAPPEQPHAQLPEPQQATGWAAVNNNQTGKRGPSLDERSHPDMGQPGSPKRQKLATLMPRTSYGEQSVSSGPSLYHPPGTPESVPSMQPTRTSSTDAPLPSYQPPQSNPAQLNALRFVPFPSAQDAEPQEPWHMDSQRHSVEAGRGRGRGGRGRGRGRKSAVSNPERDTDGVEWERPAWAGSQLGVDGYYHPGQAQSPPHPIAPDSQPQHHAMYIDPHGMPPETPTPGSDPSKKSRTKPIRNADGILIRKDGRPDMRSVSSAMNLRKVHAKKEAERASENQDGTPNSNGADGEGRRDTDSPSTPNIGMATLQREDSGDSDAGTSAQGRHRENMRKIFPYGIDAPVGLAPKPDIEQQQQQQQQPQQQPQQHHQHQPPIPSQHHLAPRAELHDVKQETMSTPVNGVDARVEEPRMPQLATQADNQVTKVMMREIPDAQMGNTEFHHVPVVAETGGGGQNALS